MVKGNVEGVFGFLLSFGAVMNKASVNLHVQAPVHTCHFHLLGEYLGMELLGLRQV